MKPLFKIEKGKPVHWKGEPIDGIRHSLDISEKWKEEDLNSIGLFFLIDIKPTLGENEKISSSTIVLVDGLPTKLYDVISYIPTDEEMEFRRSKMSCSRFQLIASLTKKALLVNMEDAVQKTNNSFAKIAWDNLETFVRNGSFIQEIKRHMVNKEGLPITETELDDIFKLAISIEYN